MITTACIRFQHPRNYSPTLPPIHLQTAYSSQPPHGVCYTDALSLSTHHEPHRLSHPRPTASLGFTAVPHQRHRRCRPKTAHQNPLKTDENHRARSGQSQIPALQPQQRLPHRLDTTRTRSICHLTNPHRPRTARPARNIWHPSGVLQRDF